MTLAAPVLVAAPSMPDHAMDVVPQIHPQPHHHTPKLAMIMKHLGLSLLMANVVPSVLFFLCLRAGNVWTALIAALVWCYGAMAWRLRTKRRASGLLMISMVGLTAKTVLALASGSTFIYFLQPAVTDGIVAVLFLLSLATARPVVARLAGDFYPMNDEVAGRPAIQKLFWRLTLFWAGLCLMKSIVTVFLLENMSTVSFVEAKSVFVLAVVIGGAAVTVAAAVRVAKVEGLLHIPHPVTV
ncbi:MAG TPA: VC0807 family protein [Mycobacteriales bacterium]|nr:VC0807 family protein [Mycobacteriales bacterium]